MFMNTFIINEDRDWSQSNKQILDIGKCEHVQICQCYTKINEYVL